MKCLVNIRERFWVVLYRTRYFISAGILLIGLAIIHGCSRGDVQMNSDTSKNYTEMLKIVSKQKIIFGHQSVGRNIIDGLIDIGKDSPSYKLNVIDMEKESRTTGPFFAHFLVGANKDPASKIASFEDQMNRNTDNYDVAFFKFCYVDVNGNTDAHQLFENYKKAISKMKQKFPNTVFVHVTIPITSIKTGLKGFLYKIRGKSDGIDSNIIRTRYNDLLRKEFAGREPVFDLAEIESTTPDGSRIRDSRNGLQYESLYPLYTNDGGHLNEIGRKRCAMALLETLSNAVNTQSVLKR